MITWPDLVFLFVSFCLFFFENHLDILLVDVGRSMKQEYRLGGHHIVGMITAQARAVVTGRNRI